MNGVESKLVSFPYFLKAKRVFSLELLKKYGVTPCFILTAGRKGWDVKSNGEEIYFVTELSKWIPSKYFEIVTDFCPN
jgi:hypothetical protein